MNYTCPKCGKKMDLSTEVLINSEYKVICPQCLSQLHIVGDYAYIPHDALDLGTSVEPSRSINCPKCGHEASTGAHFCPNCGASFDEPTPSRTDDTIEDATVLPPPLPNVDPLYNDAVRFLANCYAITPMMLRDHFGISDERAAELIRQLEAGGAIGPYNNGGPRQILIPHRTLIRDSRAYRYDVTQDPAAQQRPGQQPGRVTQRRGPGCITTLLIFMFFFYLLKACGG